MDCSACAAASTEDKVDCRGEKVFRLIKKPSVFTVSEWHTEPKEFFCGNRVISQIDLLLRKAGLIALSNWNSLILILCRYSFRSLNKASFIIGSRAANLISSLLSNVTERFSF